MTNNVLSSHEIPLISRRQLARRWGVSTETLKRRERTGQLPALKFNARLLRYRVADIERIEREALTSAGREVETCACS